MINTIKERLDNEKLTDKILTFLICGILLIIKMIVLILQRLSNYYSFISSNNCLISISNASANFPTVSKRGVFSMEKHSKSLP